VVDLGASPGGWLQVAREIVGPEGLVLGVDIKPISPIPFPNVHLIEADIYDLEIGKKILNELRGFADVLLSDLSPQIIGAWDVDHARQIDLARRAIAIAKNVLRPKGNALIKMFHGPELKGLQEKLGRCSFGAACTSRKLVDRRAARSTSWVLDLGIGSRRSERVWKVRLRMRMAGIGMLLLNRI